MPKKILSVKNVLTFYLLFLAIFAGNGFAAIREVSIESATDRLLVADGTAGNINIYTAAGINNPITVPATDTIKFTGIGDKRIVVRAKSNIMLSNVSISGGNWEAMSIEAGLNNPVNLILDGDNFLTGGIGSAGLRVPRNGVRSGCTDQTFSISIDGQACGNSAANQQRVSGSVIISSLPGGKLIANGGVWRQVNEIGAGAGIGAGYYYKKAFPGNTGNDEDYACGNVVINSGQITAIGGAAGHNTNDGNPYSKYAAGIGGNGGNSGTQSNAITNGGAACNLTINGGTVLAKSSRIDNWGIGGGCTTSNSNCGTAGSTIINGGSVNATIQTGTVTTPDMISIEHIGTRTGAGTTQNPYRCAGNNATAVSNNNNNDLSNTAGVSYYYCNNNPQGTTNDYCAEGTNFRYRSNNNLTRVAQTFTQAGLTQAQRALGECYRITTTAATTTNVSVQNSDGAQLSPYTLTIDDGANAQKKRVTFCDLGNNITCYFEDDDEPNGVARFGAKEVYTDANRNLYFWLPNDFTPDVNDNLTTEYKNPEDPTKDVTYIWSGSNGNSHTFSPAAKLPRMVLPTANPYTLFAYKSKGSGTIDVNHTNEADCSPNTSWGNTDQTTTGCKIAEEGPSNYVAASGAYGTGFRMQGSNYVAAVGHPIIAYPGRYIENNNGAMADIGTETDNSKIRWYRSSTLSPTKIPGEKILITGANGTEYKPTAADYGMYIWAEVQVRGSNNRSTNQATSSDNWNALIPNVENVIYPDDITSYPAIQVGVVVTTDKEPKQIPGCEGSVEGDCQPFDKNTVTTNYMYRNLPSPEDYLILPQQSLGTFSDITAMASSTDKDAAYTWRAYTDDAKTVSIGSFLTNENAANTTFKLPEICTSEDECKAPNDDIILMVSADASATPKIVKVEVCENDDACALTIDINENDVRTVTGSHIPKEGTIKISFDRSVKTTYINGENQTAEMIFECSNNANTYGVCLGIGTLESSAKLTCESPILVENEDPNNPDAYVVTCTYTNLQPGSSNNLNIRGYKFRTATIAQFIQGLKVERQSYFVWDNDKSNPQYFTDGTEENNEPMFIVGDDIVGNISRKLDDQGGDIYGFEYYWEYSPTAVSTQEPKTTVTTTMDSVATTDPMYWNELIKQLTKKEDGSIEEGEIVGSRTPIAFETDIKKATLKLPTDKFGYWVRLVVRPISKNVVAGRDTTISGTPYGIGETSYSAWRHIGVLLRPRIPVTNPNDEGWITPKWTVKQNESTSKNELVYEGEENPADKDKDSWNCGEDVICPLTKIPYAFDNQNRPTGYQALYSDVSFAGCNPLDPSPAIIGCSKEGYIVYNKNPIIIGAAAAIVKLTLTNSDKSSIYNAISNWQDDYTNKETFENTTSSIEMGKFATYKIVNVPEDGKIMLTPLVKEAYIPIIANAKLKQVETTQNDNNGQSKVADYFLKNTLGIDNNTLLTKRIGADVAVSTDNEFVITFDMEVKGCEVVGDDSKSLFGSVMLSGDGITEAKSLYTKETTWEITDATYGQINYDCTIPIQTIRVKFVDENGVSYLEPGKNYTINITDFKSTKSSDLMKAEQFDFKTAPGPELADVEIKGIGANKEEFAILQPITGKFTFLANNSAYEDVNICYSVKVAMTDKDENPKTVKAHSVKVGGTDVEKIADADEICQTVNSNTEIEFATEGIPAASFDARNISLEVRTVKEGNVTVNKIAPHIENVQVGVRMMATVECAPGSYSAENDAEKDTCKDITVSYNGNSILNKANAEETEEPEEEKYAVVFKGIKNIVDIELLSEAEKYDIATINAENENATIAGNVVTAGKTVEQAFSAPEDDIKLTVNVKMNLPTISSVQLGNDKSGAPAEGDGADLSAYTASAVIGHPVYVSGIITSSPDFNENAGFAYEYKWEICNETNCATQTTIQVDGADGKEDLAGKASLAEIKAYTPVAADFGKYIRLNVRAIGYEEVVLGENDGWKASNWMQVGVLLIAGEPANNKEQISDIAFNFCPTLMNSPYCVAEKGLVVFDNKPVNLSYASNDILKWKVTDWKDNYSSKTCANSEPPENATVKVPFDCNVEKNTFSYSVDANELTGTITLTPTVEEIIAPVVASVTVTDVYGGEVNISGTDGTNISRNDNLIITFNNPVLIGENIGKIRISGASSDAEDCVWTEENKVCTIQLSGLGFSQNYKIDIYDFKNLTADKMTEVYSYNFTTAGPPSYTKPTFPEENPSIGSEITVTGKGGGSYQQNGGGEEDKSSTYWAIGEIGKEKTKIPGTENKETYTPKKEDLGKEVCFVISPSDGVNPPGTDVYSDCKRIGVVVKMGEITLNQAKGTEHTITIGDESATVTKSGSETSLSFTEGNEISLIIYGLTSIRWSDKDASGNFTTDKVVEWKANDEALANSQSPSITFDPSKLATLEGDIVIDLEIDVGDDEIQAEVIEIASFADNTIKPSGTITVGFNKEIAQEGEISLNGSIATKCEEKEASGKYLFVYSCEYAGLPLGQEVQLLVTKFFNNVGAQNQILILNYNVGDQATITPIDFALKDSETYPAFVVGDTVAATFNYVANQGGALKTWTCTWGEDNCGVNLVSDVTYSAVRAFTSKDFAKDITLSITPNATVTVKEGDNGVGHKTDSTKRIGVRVVLDSENDIECVAGSITQEKYNCENISVKVGADDLDRLVLYGTATVKVTLPGGIPDEDINDDIIEMELVNAPGVTKTNSATNGEFNINPTAPEGDIAVKIKVRKNFTAPVFALANDLGSERLLKDYLNSFAVGHEATAQLKDAQNENITESDVKYEYVWQKSSSLTTWTDAEELKRGFSNTGIVPEYVPVADDFGKYIRLGIRYVVLSGEEGSETIEDSSGDFAYSSPNQVGVLLLPGKLAEDSEEFIGNINFAGCPLNTSSPYCATNDGKGIGLIVFNTNELNLGYEITTAGTNGGYKVTGWSDNAGNTCDSEESAFICDKAKGNYKYALNAMAGDIEITPIVGSDIPTVVVKLSKGEQTLVANADPVSDISIVDNNLVLTFADIDRTGDNATKGSIKINNVEQKTNCGEDWATTDVCTIALNDLAFNTDYRVEVSGFRNEYNSQIETQSFEFVTGNGPTVDIAITGDINGTYAVGHTLTATLSNYAANAAGTKGDHEISWTVNDVQAVADAESEGLAYTPKATDFGKEVRLSVTPKDNNGKEGNVIETPRTKVGVLVNVNANFAAGGAEGTPSIAIGGLDVTLDASNNGSVIVTEKPTAIQLTSSNPNAAFDKWQTDTKGVTIASASSSRTTLDIDFDEFEGTEIDITGYMKDGIIPSLWVAQGEKEDPADDDFFVFTVDKSNMKGLGKKIVISSTDGNFCYITKDTDSYVGSDDEYTLDISYADFKTGADCNGDEGFKTESGIKYTMVVEEGTFGDGNTSNKLTNFTFFGGAVNYAVKVSSIMINRTVDYGGYDAEELFANANLTVQNIASTAKFMLAFEHGENSLFEIESLNLGQLDEGSVAKSVTIKLKAADTDVGTYTDTLWVKIFGITQDVSTEEPKIEQPIALTFNVMPRLITIAEANFVKFKTPSRVYDGTTASPDLDLDTEPNAEGKYVFEDWNGKASFDEIPSDIGVVVSKGNYATKDVGTSKEVTIKYELVGDKAKNYALQSKTSTDLTVFEQSNSTGAITPKPINVVFDPEAIAAGFEKPYDGLNTFDMDEDAYDLNGDAIEEGDNLVLNKANAIFTIKDGANVAWGKDEDDNDIVISKKFQSILGLELEGDDAQNYTLGTVLTTALAEELEVTVLPLSLASLAPSFEDKVMATATYGQNAEPEGSNGYALWEQKLYSDKAVEIADNFVNGTWVLVEKEGLVGTYNNPAKFKAMFNPTSPNYKKDLEVAVGLTVNLKQISLSATVSPDMSTKEYDKTTDVNEAIWDITPNKPVGWFDGYGEIEGDDLTGITVASAEYSDANVGNPSITVEWQLNEDLSKKYELVSDSYTTEGKINKRNLNITVFGFADKDYDGTDKVKNAVSSGLTKELNCGFYGEGEDMEEIDCSETFGLELTETLTDDKIIELFSFAQSDAGENLAIARTGDVVFANWLTGDVAANYNLDIVAGNSATINQYEFASIDALKAVSTYGTMKTYIERKDWQPSFKGIGDADITGIWNILNGSELVGDAGAEPTLIEDGAEFVPSNKNYAPLKADIALTVNPKKLSIESVTGTILNKVYDGTDTLITSVESIEANLAAGQMVGDDVVEAKVSKAYYASKNSDNERRQNITIEFKLEGDRASNYKAPDNYITTGTISPRPVTIIFAPGAAKDKAFDGTDYAEVDTEGIELEEFNEVGSGLIEADSNFVKLIFDPDNRNNFYFASGGAVIENEKTGEAIPQAINLTRNLFRLEGIASGNYALVYTTLEAIITRASYADVFCQSNPDLCEDLTPKDGDKVIEEVCKAYPSTCGNLGGLTLEQICAQYPAICEKVAKDGVLQENILEVVAKFLPKEPLKAVYGDDINLTSLSNLEASVAKIFPTAGSGTGTWTWQTVGLVSRNVGIYDNVFYAQFDHGNPSFEALKNIPIKLEVLPRQLGAEATAQTREYEPDDVNVELNIIATNVVPNDYSKVELTGWGTVADDNAGTGKKVTVKEIAWGGVDAQVKSNYILPIIGEISNNVTVNISKRTWTGEVPDPAPTPREFVFDSTLYGTLSGIELWQAESGYSKWQWADGETKPEDPKERASIKRKYMARFIPEDSLNYNIIEREIELTIKQRNREDAIAKENPVVAASECGSEFVDLTITTLDPSTEVWYNNVSWGEGNVTVPEVSLRKYGINSISYNTKAQAYDIPAKPQSYEYYRYVPFSRVAGWMRDDGADYKRNLTVIIDSTDALLKNVEFDYSKTRWYLDDKLVFTGRTYDVFKEGRDYSVVLTTKSGEMFTSCKESNSFPDIPPQTVPIMPDNNIKLIAHSFSTRLVAGGTSLSIDTPLGSKISIYTAKGELVSQMRTVENNTVVRVPSTKGMYIVKLEAK